MARHLDTEDAVKVKHSLGINVNYNGTKIKGLLSRKRQKHLLKLQNSNAH